MSQTSYNLNIKALSLFSNVGIAETYFSSYGVEVVLANELLEDRANFYRHLYPNTNVICGDITDTSVYNRVLNEAQNLSIDLIVATPPCQGMSNAGKKDPADPRNNLITYAVNIIKEIKPRYVILENVPMQMHTKINYMGEKMLIPQYVQEELGFLYNFNTEQLVNTKDYGIPQSRQRYIYLLARKDTNSVWEFPKPSNETLTLKDSISHLPSLDPLLRDKNERWRFPDYERKAKLGCELSKWHYPPAHSWRQVEWMLHTPSGQSAFKNEIYYPKKDNRRIKGAPRTYMRMDWEKPATTVLQNNGVISTFSTVHPGRLIASGATEHERIYSDARTLTIYELLVISSLPTNWDIPNWASEILIRKVIGEGIPPKLLSKALSNLVRLKNRCSL
jgi:DNA (cytosine-5)-methyltransferase 1